MSIKKFIVNKVVAEFPDGTYYRWGGDTASSQHRTYNFYNATDFSGMYVSDAEGSMRGNIAGVKFKKIQIACTLESEEEVKE